MTNQQFSDALDKKAAELSHIENRNVREDRLLAIVQHLREEIRQNYLLTLDQKIDAYMVLNGFLKPELKTDSKEVMIFLFESYSFFSRFLGMIELAEYLGVRKGRIAYAYVNINKQL